MVMLIVLPESVIGPCLRPLHATGLGVIEGVTGSVAVFVTVGVRVIVGDGVNVAVKVGVFVNTGVLVGVGVGVLVGVGVRVGVRVCVAVGEDGCQVDGGTVTWIATLTRTVRALSAWIGPEALASERSRKPTILGTIG